MSILSLTDNICAIAKEFPMGFVTEQIQAAMRKGQTTLTFTRQNDHTPNVAQLKGQLHPMQARLLQNVGYTVQVGVFNIVVSGWGAAEIE